MTHNRVFGFLWGVLFGWSSMRVYEGDLYSLIGVALAIAGCLIFARNNGETNFD